MILEAYLLTSALSLTSLAINNYILKKGMKKDGFVLKKTSLSEKIRSNAPLLIFGLSPIFNIAVISAVLTGEYNLNKYMVKRLFQECEKPKVEENNYHVIEKENTEIKEITKPDEIKAPEDRISYANYEYKKECNKKECKIITKLEDIKTPEDRISYVNYEYEKAKEENKPYTLIRKR